MPVFVRRAFKVKPPRRFVPSAPSTGNLTGALSASIGEITLSAAGALTITGDLSKSIGNVTLSAAGTLPITGELSKPIGNVTLSAVGALTIDGTLSQSIGAIGLSAAGESTIAGELSKSIGDVTLSAAGATTIEGALSASIGNITLSATGVYGSTPIIEIDHETGDLSQYTSTVTDSGDLSVTAGAALAGTGYGLSALIDDTTAIYGQYAIASPYSTTGVMRARFYIDPNGITIPDLNSFVVCSFRRSIGVTQVASVLLRYASGTGYQLFCAMANDAFGEHLTSYANITDAPHYIELKLTRATSSSSLDGSLEWWIDGVQQTAVTGKDNYDLFTSLGVVMLGAVSNIDTGTSGTVYLDELVVNDTGYEIGAYVSSGATGELSASIGSITLSAAGATTIDGALSQSIGNISLSATGALSIDGALSQSIGSITLSAAGVATIEGAASSSIGEIVLSAIGVLSIDGQLAASIGAILLTASGQLTELTPTAPAIVYYPERFRIFEPEAAQVFEPEAFRTYQPEEAQTFEP